MPLRKGSLFEEVTTGIDKESVTESVETQDDFQICSTINQKEHDICISRQSNRKFSTQSDPLSYHVTSQSSLTSEMRMMPNIVEKENIIHGYHYLDGVYPTLEENAKVGSTMQPTYGCVMMLVGNNIYLLGVLEHLPVIKLDLEKLYSIKSFEGTNTNIMCVNYPNKRTRSFYIKYCNKRSRDTWFNSIVRLVC
jgi:hypothetical protein